MVLVKEENGVKTYAEWKDEYLSLKVFTNSTYDSAYNRKNVSSTTKIVDGAVVPQAADVKKEKGIKILAHMERRGIPGKSRETPRLFSTIIIPQNPPKYKTCNRTLRML